MIVTTTDGVAGHKIVKHCGLAKGCSVRSVHLGEDLMARLKNTVGGEVHEYTQIFAQVREQALDRMGHRCDREARAQRRGHADRAGQAQDGNARLGRKGPHELQVRLLEAGFALRRLSNSARTGDRKAP